MKTVLLNLRLVLISAISILALSCDGEDGLDGMDGAIGAQGEQGVQGPVGPEGPAGEDGTTVPSIYTRSGQLNTNFEDVNGTSTPLGPVLSINKVHQNSRIEVFFNSNILSGTFGSSTTFVEFQIRLNNTVGITDNRVPVRQSNATVSISLFEVFEDLPTGEHQIQIFARTNSGGSSTSVGLDPGGFGGRIVAKETF